MGRFLSGSPMGSDATRRNQRYEALPADNSDAITPNNRDSSSDEEQDNDTDEDHRVVNSERGLSSVRSTDQMLENGESREEKDSYSDDDNSKVKRKEKERKDQRYYTEETTTITSPPARLLEATSSMSPKATMETKEARDESAKAEEKSKEDHPNVETKEAVGDGDDDDELEPGAIRVRILDLNGKFFSIQCRLDWNVAAMKAKVLESTEVPIASQRLIYRGRVLEDESCLADYKVEDGHTIHLFVRMTQTPDPESANAEHAANGSGSTNRLEDASGMTIVHINSDTISSAVFPSDSARRVDPLMLDSPLGNCARRVKLWSSFFLIIYTMKVMGQFALLANDQQARSSQQEEGTDNQDRQYDYRYDYPQYYNQDPLVGGIEMLIHAFGVYIGCVGFKAAHDTDIRPIRFYCRGVVWLAILTLAEQVYITVQIAQSDYPNERIQYGPYGAQAPSKDDIVSANIFQTVMLVIMWIIAIRHSYLHQHEVNIYNQSFAAAAMNAVPPAHLPEVV